MVKYGRIALAIIAPLVLLAALLSGVHAQGTFPHTQTLDDFNRIDQGPPPSDAWVSVGEDGLVVYENECTSGGGQGAGYWNTVLVSSTSYEVFVTVTSIVDADFLGIGGINVDDATGYALIYNTSEDALQIVKISDYNNPLVSYSVVLTNGDSIGLSQHNDLLTMYMKEPGGSWSALTSTTDSSYTMTQYIFLSIPSDGIRVDDFGGGSFTIETPAPTPNTIGYNSVATITLTSGEVVAVNYSYTFGDMGVIAALLLLVVVTGVQFVYSITVKVWEWRSRR